MLSVQCPRHGSEVLLSERHITRLERTDGGLTVHWECWCGQRGSHVTGRRRRETPTL